MAITGAFCPLPWRLGGDALTGMTAAQHARFCADMVAVKRMAKLAEFSWGAVGSASTPAVITNYRGMNGVGLGFAPTAGAAGGGLTFTWGSGRFTDDYQVSAPICPRGATVTASGTTFRRGTFELRPNGITIYFFDDAGALVDPQPGGTCKVW